MCDREQAIQPLHDFVLAHRHILAQWETLKTQTTTPCSDPTCTPCFWFSLTQRAYVHMDCIESVLACERSEQCRPPPPSLLCTPWKQEIDEADGSISFVRHLQGSTQWVALLHAPLRGFVEGNDPMEPSHAFLLSVRTSTGVFAFDLPGNRVEWAWKIINHLLALAGYTDDATQLSK